MDALLLDMREWGVILQEDAETRYSHRIVAELLNNQYIATVPTAFGPALHLDTRGRRRIGLSGPHHPEPTAILNQIAIRDAKTILEREPDTELIPRVHGKYMFSLVRSNKQFRRSYAVAARYTSMTSYSVRRIYRRLFVEEHTESRASGLYVFVAPEEVDELTATVEPKWSEFKVPRRSLKIFALPRSKPITLEKVDDQS